MKLGNALSCIAAALCLASITRADVVVATENSASIKIVLPVAASPDKVYASFIDVGRWWDKAHTFSGNAANLKLDATAGGCFCETLPNGGGVRHLTVVYVAPNQRITLSGALGPLQSAGLAGALTVSFMAKDAGTQLVLVYNLGGYYPNGLTSVAGDVNEVLQHQMERLKQFAESGNAEGPVQAPPKP